MPDDVADGRELDTQIAAVLGGALDEFVSRRDALAKELRAAGRADEAAAVKGLRKPTRPVWALDAAVLADRDPVERVAAAVIGMIAAQDGRGSVREAAGDLRDAVRDLARAGAKAAAAAGYKVEQPDLVPPIMAVVGDADAFEALRAGRLQEIPSAGELDMLTGAPPLAPVTTPVRRKTEAPAPAPAADAKALREARKSVEQAEATAAAARDQFASAERLLAEAEMQATDAEDRLEQAEAGVRTARDQLRHAQQAARAANHALRTADREAARARARLGSLAGD